MGLDTESRAFLLAHVHDLCRTRGIGVLWATHLIDEAADARVIVLHHGRILADATSAALPQRQHGTLADAFNALTQRAAA